MSAKTKKVDLTFAEALNALEAGKLVRREAWGKNHVIGLQKNFGIRAYQRTVVTGGVIVEREYDAVYCVSKSFDGELSLSWSPSAKDLLAKDWQLGETVEQLNKEAKKKAKESLRTESEQSALDKAQELIEESKEESKKGTEE